MSCTWKNLLHYINFQRKLIIGKSAYHIIFFSSINIYSSIDRSSNNYARVVARFHNVCGSFNWLFTTLLANFVYACDFIYAREETITALQTSLCALSVRIIARKYLTIKMNKGKK